MAKPADQAVAADTRVGVLLSNDAALDCILTALGAMTLSAAVVPLSPRWADAELEYALTLTEPVLVVTDRAGLDRLASLVPDLDCLSVEARPGMSSWQPFSGDAPELPVDAEPAADLDRLASLLFTSGTTARPKAVMHSHETTLAAGRACSAALGITPDDIYQGAFPFFTSSALNIACAACWTVGAGFVIEHLVGNAERLALMRDEVTTLYHGVPSVLHFMAEEAAERPMAHPALRRIAYGGAPMPPHIRQRLKEIWPDADHVQIYGSTESGPAGTVIDEATMAVHPMAVGQAMEGYTVHVVDDSDTPCAAGQSGAVMLEGPGVAIGYWRNPEATGATFSGRTVRMGDTGWLDETGLLTFEDRAKDWEKSIASSEAWIHIAHIRLTSRHLASYCFP